MAAVASIQNAAAPAAPAVEISTPRWLAGSLVFIGLLALAFLICAIVAVRDQRGSLKTIAVDSAKSVVAAEAMAAALADMDACAANALLTVNPQQRPAAIASYNAARKQLSESLVDAAHNITLEDEEAAIKTIADYGAVYDAQVQAAFTLQNGNPKAALDRYLQAAVVMDSVLTKAASDVDTVNRTELDNSYNSIGGKSLVKTIFVWVTGILMVVLLLRVQFFLTERMRRTLNPLCLLATLVAGILLLYTNHAISVTSHQIEIVKKDAFDSIHTLWKAKAVAYEASALESRYLLDRQHSDTHQVEFNTQAVLIANDPAALAFAAQGGRQPSASAKGFLPEEMRNITFQGEKEAADEAARLWGLYVKIDSEIRADDKSGQYDDAVKRYLGTGVNQAKWAFTGFIAALEKTISINQAEFEKARDRGFQALANFELIASVMALLAVVFAFFGLLPRIREYSV